jgi:chromosome segregation ATPase
MAEIEYQGIKFKGGKIFIILSLIGTISGGGWSMYKFIDDYLELKDAVSSYVSPDLTSYDEQLAVLETEISSILEEVTLVNDVAQSLKSDIRSDLKQMKQDIRNIDGIVNDIEDRVKKNEREINQDFKTLEEELDLKINKALNNPLSSLN